MGDWEKLFWKLGLDGCSTSELEEGVMFPEGSHETTDEIGEGDIEAAMNGEDKDPYDDYESPAEDNVASTLFDLAEANRQRALDETDEENLLLYQAAGPEERRNILAGNVPDLLSREGAKRFVREYVRTYDLDEEGENKLYLTALKIIHPNSRGRRWKGELIRTIETYVPKYQPMQEQDIEE